jgi:hypothetical protein
VGRTIHYQTQEIISQEEHELLLRIVGKYNKSGKWSRERLKLWRTHEAPKPGVEWGFTKVGNEAEARLVVSAVKEMSAAIPRLTWVLFDEGKPSKGKIIIKNGKFHR